MPTIPVYTASEYNFKQIRKNCNLPLIAKRKRRSQNYTQGNSLLEVRSAARYHPHKNMYGTIH
mgnify:CR=1 FL=1